MSIKNLKVTAMPQLIPQSELTIKYIDYWKQEALSAYRNKSLTPIALKERDLAFYHYKKSALNGVLFVMSLDNTEIAYLYAYEKCTVAGKPKAAEALAYTFKMEARGLMKEVFFDHLLPYVGFIVTDSMYTPDGKKWFEAEYATAFDRKHKVYSIDLSTNAVSEVDRADFHKVVPLYWGTEEEFQKYRFAIELAGVPK